MSDTTTKICDSIDTEGGAAPAPESSSSSSSSSSSAAAVIATKQAVALAPSSSNNNKENSANVSATSSNNNETTTSPTMTNKRPASSSAAAASNNPEAATDAAGAAKRTKTGAEEQTSSSTSSASSKKSGTTNSGSSSTAAAPMDLAVTLGYKPGDRLEVQWEIEKDDGETVVHWWGASLLPFDGRTEDSVAIRTLHYDVCPELGFSETSDEDVIFLGQDLLVSPDSTTQLTYRREGEEDVYWLTEDDMDEQLNEILMGALAKNQAAWRNLPAAQQAMIAEKIKTKKDELLKVLKSRKEVITSSSIQDILRETFGGTPSSSA